MRRSKAGPKRAFFIYAGFSAAGLVLVLGVYFTYWGLGRHRPFTKQDLADVLEQPAKLYEFPSEIDLTWGEGRRAQKLKAKVNYTFDPALQNAMEVLLKAYSPDYGAFVALDARTGRVLSMVSSTRKKTQENFALRATFPSASVFKVVTAAAAIESKKYSANTVIPFNGANHTLYKGNILKTRITRWTRYTTLRDAFAHSINTVFGKIGAFAIGPEDLRMYADRFGFNRKIASDLPVGEGRAEIPEDVWGLAESASGFTRENTMSPLQGALIAASVINGGVMMEPFVVESLQGIDGTRVYSAEPKVGVRTVDASTASEIQTLMHETIARGTSRASFRGVFGRQRNLVDVGGKTGSLTGKNPFGKYDWFIGYAQAGELKIAVAALTIHERLWRVKSSYLARRAFEIYLKDRLREGKVALR